MQVSPFKIVVDDIDRLDRQRRNGTVAKVDCDPLIRILFRELSVCGSSPCAVVRLFECFLSQFNHLIIQQDL